MKTKAFEAVQTKTTKSNPMGAIIPLEEDRKIEEFKPIGLEDE